MFVGYIPPREGEEPQTIQVSSRVAAMLSTHRRALVVATADGSVGEVDWDLRESSFPVAVTRDFGRWVGYCERVQVADDRVGEVFYAQVQRTGKGVIWGRFVKRAPAVETTCFTVLLRPQADYDLRDMNDIPTPTGWLVVGGYAGPPAPPFPGDPFEHADSRAYWRRHALLEGVMPYKADTVTKTCPWGDAEE